MQLLPSFLQGWLMIKSSSTATIRYHNNPFVTAAFVTTTTTTTTRTARRRCQHSSLIPSLSLCSKNRKSLQLFSTTGSTSQHTTFSTKNEDEDYDKKNTGEQENVSDIQQHQQQQQTIPVWNHPKVQERVIQKKRNNKVRFRQHVNPLARIYQQATILPEQWPNSVYDTVQHRPLHLDIGCSKGGFLIDLCQKELQDSNDINNNNNQAQQKTPYNYLGLEIRPGVAAFAKERIAVHQLQGKLDFLGCNANVDLDRLLKLYQSQYSNSEQRTNSNTTDQGDDSSNNSNVNENQFCLHRVTIQFPDPHFKTQHMKRRVVTTSLVNTIAKYMPSGGTIVLQSDIQSVLDDMRKQFRDITNNKTRSITTSTEQVVHEENGTDDNFYFIDSINELDEYIAENSLGVPTEREQSVLNQGLPVYRSLLTRSACPWKSNL